LGFGTVAATEQNKQAERCHISHGIAPWKFLPQTSLPLMKTFHFPYGVTCAEFVEKRIVLKTGVAVEKLPFRPKQPNLGG
jgi:hypothetical protein